MAWGDRKPEGNEKAQLPSGFLSPQALGAGPLNITVPERLVPRGSLWSRGLIRARRLENGCPTAASNFGTVMLTDSSARPGG
jgi:hypothetical protein